MMMKTIKLLFAFTVFTVAGYAQAQVALVSAGGSAKGAGGSASCTIGQVFYATVTSSNATVQQGIQKGYSVIPVAYRSDESEIEAGVGSERDSAAETTINCSVYPNPATDYINLIIDGADISGITYNFYDATGKLLLSGNVVNNSSNIFLGETPGGIYYLTVNNAAREVKTFKIIKY